MMVRRIRMIVSGLVVAGIFAAGVATCTAGAMPEAAQMACCRAGHHTCGKDGAPADCCKKHSSPEPEYNTVAKTDSLKAPARLFLALLTPDNPIADAVVVVQPLRPASASPPIKPLGPPVYIVLSTLLL
jgi:hypothetical protein